jgi:SAM-dependent methyltransferase
VNEHHAKLCSSPEWAEYLQSEVLSAVAEHVTFGDEMLEIGPGPGAATEWLRHRVQRLVAVEVDPEAGRRLRDRYSGTNVEVVVADATDLDLLDASFDSVGSFTMLHHVPTADLQNQILAEALRVLRPGGVLVGSDSLASNDLHHFHEGDTYNPLEPASLLVRLQTLGYARVTLDVDHVLRFVAYKSDAPTLATVNGQVSDADASDARETSSR